MISFDFFKKKRNKGRMIPRLLICAVILSLPSISFAQNSPIEDSVEILEVSIVFHVLFSDARDSASADLIMMELSDLNANFLAKNDMSFLEPEFKDIVGNPMIQFNLLDSCFHKDTSIKGIKWVKVPNDNRSTKLSPKIKKNNCINVYFLSRSGALSDTPGKYIEINIDYLGKNSKTLTHEVGHNLGLYHLWGESNCSFCKILLTKIIFKGDDGIHDTPKQFNCTDLKLKYKECPIEKKKFKKRNYNNFMDYGCCRCMFTEEQVKKMRQTVLKNFPQN